MSKFRNLLACQFILLFLFSSLFVHSQDSQDDARRDWMKGYSRLEKAEKAVSDGNELASLQLYREALSFFEIVKRKYPQWNPSLLNFRINYCQNKITELEKNAYSEVEEMSRENLLKRIAEQAKLMNDDAQKIKQLNNSVNLLSESLQRARAEAAINAAAEQEYKKLQTSNIQLEKGYQLIKSKLDETNQELEKIRQKYEGKSLLQKLKDENKIQKEQIKESAKIMERLQTNLKKANADYEKANSESERQKRLLGEAEKLMKMYADQISKINKEQDNLNRQQNILKLQSQQQEVEIKRQEKIIAGFEKEKNELQNEIKNLRTFRDKFVKNQENVQKLQKQIVEYENLLKEKDEKYIYERLQKDKLVEAEGVYKKELTEEFKSTERNLLKSQDYALLLEKQIAQLRDEREEYEAISAQLKEKENQLNIRDNTIKEQSERLANLNALVLTKNDEANSANVELQGTKRKLSNLENRYEQLNEQLQGIFRRRSEFAKENEELTEKLNKQIALNEQVSEKLKTRIQEIEAKNALNIKLEQAIQKLEKNTQKLQEEKKLQEQKYKAKEEEIGNYQKQLDNIKLKSSAVDGITENFRETKEDLLKRNREFEDLQKKYIAEQAQLLLLREQIKRKDEEFAKLSNATKQSQDQVWLQRIAQLNEKLEQEESRSKTLEVLLSQKDAELKEQAGTAPSKTNLFAYTKPSFDSPEQENNAAKEEQEILLNGFLRQGLEAEKNGKKEAALWNYQEVLKLEPNNHFALKRLGLIAANHGNNEDTAKYLKLAFRYNPDDNDVLLALGFAMLNLNQPEWAFSYLGRAIALQPANSVLTRLFAGVLVDLGWTQAAELQFEKTLRLDPKDHNAAFNLAVLCATDKPARLQEAKKWYNMALQNGAEKDPAFEAALK